MPRNIIITGADNGIGLALTKSLLEMGGHIAALDLSLENLPRSSNLLPFTCDVTDPEVVGRGLAKLVGKTRQNKQGTAQ